MFAPISTQHGGWKMSEFGASLVYIVRQKCLQFSCQVSAEHVWALGEIFSTTTKRKTKEWAQGTEGTGWCGELDMDKDCFGQKFAVREEGAVSLYHIKRVPLPPTLFWGLYFE